MRELVLEPTSRQGLPAVAALMRRAFPEARKYSKRNCRSDLLACGDQ